MAIAKTWKPKGTLTPLLNYESFVVTPPKLGITTSP